MSMINDYTNNKHKIYLVLPHKGNPLEDTELVSVMVIYYLHHL